MGYPQKTTTQSLWDFFAASGKFLLLGLLGASAAAALVISDALGYIVAPKHLLRSAIMCGAIVAAAALLHKLAAVCVLFALSLLFFVRLVQQWQEEDSAQD